MPSSFLVLLSFPVDYLDFAFANEGIEDESNEDRMDCVARIQEMTYRGVRLYWLEKRGIWIQKLFYCLGGMKITL